MALFYSEKLHLEIDFLEWCRNHNKAPTFEGFVGFLEQIGCVNEDAVKKKFEEYYHQKEGVR